MAGMIENGGGWEPERGGSIGCANVVEVMRELEVGSTEGGDVKAILGSMGEIGACVMACVMSMGEQDAWGRGAGVQVCIMTSNQGKESN
jgi:hypothetical protein